MQIVTALNIFQAAVWLRYAECLYACKQLPDSVEAYKRVVELAPAHLSARVSLSTIQQQLGQHEEALASLDHGKFELHMCAATSPTISKT